MGLSSNGSSLKRVGFKHLLCMAVEDFAQNNKGKELLITSSTIIARSGRAFK